MIASSRLPTATILALNGAKLVSSVNPADPTNGVVPYRDVGLPLEFRTLYESNQDSDFHRYARVDLIGTFDTAQSCAAALPAAETALRTHPAPGVETAQPVDQKPQFKFVTAKSVPMGWITTRWDAPSRSIVNVTTPAHLMRDGFVVRQVAAVGRNMFVTTFGEGSNIIHLLAWANGTWGGGGFKDLDYLISRGISGEKNFQATPGTPPNGAEVTYWTGAREQQFQAQQMPYSPI